MTYTLDKDSVQQSPESQMDEVRRVVIDAARTELAAVSAAVKFWAGWVESADRYTRTLEDELTNIENGKMAPGEAVARVADASRVYLRELADLPRLSVRHFTDELDRIGRPKARRTRTARAKD
jgi:hypothetical protein